MVGVTGLMDVERFQHGPPYSVCGTVGQYASRSSAPAGLSRTIFDSSTVTLRCRSKLDVPWPAIINGAGAGASGTGFRKCGIEIDAGPQPEVELRLVLRGKTVNACDSNANNDTMETVSMSS